VTTIHCAVLLGLSGFSVHMVVVVLRQYREIKESVKLLEVARQRILDHIQERQEWRKEKDKMQRELDEVEGKAKQ